MIEPWKTPWIDPGIRAHERGAPALCLQPAQRPRILSLGDSASYLVTLKADVLRAKTSPADFTPHTEPS